MRPEFRATWQHHPENKRSRSASGSTPTGCVLKSAENTNSEDVVNVTRVHLSGLEGSAQYKTSWQNALIEYPHKKELI